MHATYTHTATCYQTGFDWLKQRARKCVHFQSKYKWNGWEKQRKRVNGEEEEEEKKALSIDTQRQ